MGMGNILFFLLIIRYPVNSLIKDIDIGGCKLPRADAAFE